MPMMTGKLLEFKVAKTWTHPLHMSATEGMSERASRTLQDLLAKKSDVMNGTVLQPTLRCLTTRTPGRTGLPIKQARGLQDKTSGEKASCTTSSDGRSSTPVRCLSLSLSRPPLVFSSRILPPEWHEHARFARPHAETGLGWMAAVDGKLHSMSLRVRPFASGSFHFVHVPPSFHIESRCLCSRYLSMVPECLNTERL